MARKEPHISHVKLSRCRVRSSCRGAREAPPRTETDLRALTGGIFAGAASAVPRKAKRPDCVWQHAKTVGSTSAVPRKAKLREKLPLKRAVPKRTSATRFAHSTRAASHRARSGAHARAFSWRSNRTVRGCAPCHSAVYRHMHDAFFHDRRIFRRCHSAVCKYVPELCRRRTLGTAGRMRC